MKFISKKTFISLACLLLCTVGLFAEEVITDWKGMTTGKSPMPVYISKLFTKNDAKKLRKEFQLNATDSLYYAEENASDEKVALSKASLKAKAQIIADSGVEIKYPNLINTIPVSGLKKVCDHWVKIEGGPNGTYYTAYVVYTISDEDKKNILKFVDEFNFEINPEIDE